MFCVYLLRSFLTGEHYTGSTHNHEQRLGQHNDGLVRSTKHARPWELIYYEEYPTRAEAVRRERFLKSGQGREELKRILKDKTTRSSAG
jgi:putative endonuclease